MNQSVRRRLSSYLSVTLLLTLLSTGIVAPEITAEQASANLTQPASPSNDLNNECDQNYISVMAGVSIQKIGNDCVIQFRSVGTYVWRTPKGLTNISQLLVVGGGGSGGLRHGGGGGAGGYVSKSNVVVNPHTNISIVVGIGGGRAGGAGNNGGDSLFNNTFRAKGGGGGAANFSQSGNAGGSGGGSTGPTGVPGLSNQRTAGDTDGLGRSGGRGTGNVTGSSVNFWTGGGGGGSGSAGETTTGLVNKGGNGGAGTLNDITGELVCYAAGGGGGTNQLGKPGAGGSCIRPTDSAVITSGAQGGNNAWGASFQRDLDATPNTGSGGGGGGYNDGRSELGGAGGHGIVVVRYTLPTASLDLNAANYRVASANTWVDASTGKNNGTLQGGPTFVAATDTNPSHFRFDGARSQYVSTSRFIPAAGPLNFSGGVWFRTTSNQGAKIIGFENTQLGTGTGSYDRHLYIGTDNRLYWGVYDGTARIVRTTQKVNDGKWHYAFFTSTWTYGGNVMSLSLNGGPAVSLSHPNRAQDYGGWWRIGGYQLNGWPNARTGYFTGDIARATIYPWVLSPEEARNKYFEMYSPIKVDARASTSSTAIDVSWNRVSGATGYKVHLYNAAGTTKLSSSVLPDSNTVTTTISSQITANTGYRASVEAIFSTAETMTVSNESEKSEVVVPQGSECLPERSTSGPYTILRFKTSGNQTTSCRWNVPAISSPLEYLVVGGGGGGAQNHGAGGQGGFYNTGSLGGSSVSGSTVTITVGAGGAGARNAFNDSQAAKETPSPLREGLDGSASALTTSSRAIMASGGAGGVTPWENLACLTPSRVTRDWLLAKPGTPVVGKQGLAGGQGGAPRTAAANGVRNPGSTGLSTLANVFNLPTPFSQGGSSGIWGTGANQGANAAPDLGNGGQGGGSSCYGGGNGGSGTVLLRYLTPLPKEASPLIKLPDSLTASLYGRFLASDYNTLSRTWKDSSGKGRDVYASRGNPRLEAVRVGTNNAKNDFHAVTGTPNDSIKFFALPQNYTLFHVARYNGANRNRIFNGIGTNWLSGFWAGRVGVAFHQDWLTANGLADNKNPDTDWIVSTDKRNSYRSQGVDRTLRNASYQFGPLTSFAINEGDFAEYSDFQVAEVIVYDRELNETETAQVEEYLQQKYTYENPDVNGNVAGGGWQPSQYCPSGQVAVGVRATTNDAGFSQFQLVCQPLADNGTQTTGENSFTPSTIVGNAAGARNYFYCDTTSPRTGLGDSLTATQTKVVKGIRFARGGGLGAQDFYVGGLNLICAPLGEIDSPAVTVDSGFFGGRNLASTSISDAPVNPVAYKYYPAPQNPAQCPAGQVVIGFNAKSGSVTDAIQIICGVPPLAKPGKPTLDSVAATLKTLVASWDPVPGAYSYTVALYDSLSTLISTAGLSDLAPRVQAPNRESVTITTANFPGLLDGTPYRVSVTANGDGINTLYSPESNLSDSASTVSAAALASWLAPSDPTYPSPNIDGSASKTVSAGVSVTIIETPLVTGTATYQWLKNGVAIPGANETNLTLTSVTNVDSGQYSVVVTNTLYGGASSSVNTSSPFTLDVLEIFTPKTGLVAKASESFTVGIEARGPNPKTFSLTLPESTIETFTALGLYLNPTTGVISDSGVATIARESFTAIVNVTANGVTASTDTFTVKFVDSRLATAANVRLETGNGLKTLKATWDMVESATAYSVLLYDSTNTLVRTRGLDSAVVTTPSGAAESRTVTITTANYPGLVDGESYTVRVIAFDTTGKYADSDSSTVSSAAFTALPITALTLTSNLSVLDASGQPTGELRISESTVKLEAALSGSSGTYSFAWFKDGLPIQPQPGGRVAISGTTADTTSTLTINRVDEIDAGVYYAVITNVLFGETRTVTTPERSLYVVDGVKVQTPINGLVTVINKPYRLPLVTTSGTRPISFTLDPNYTLPAGLSLSSESALITGTPSTQGFYPIRVVARDANNSYDTTSVFTISVVETQLDSTTVTAVASANTLKSINVSWAAVANANRYTVRLYESVTTTTSLPLAEVKGITGTSYTFTDDDYVFMEDGTRYQVVVVAVDASGAKGDSEESVKREVTTNRPPAQPVFSVNPVSPAPVSVGARVELTSTASASAGVVTYQWFKGEVELAGETDPALLIRSVQERDAGAYTVVATSTLNGVSASTTSSVANIALAFSVETPTVGLTAVAGKSYSLGIRTIGGGDAKEFTVTANTSLPNGLELVKETGEIRGIPDTAVANFPVSVDVRSGETVIRTTFTLNVVIPARTQITTVVARATPGVLKSIEVTWTAAKTGAEPDATAHLVHLYDSLGNLLRPFIVYVDTFGTTFAITAREFSALADGREYGIGVIAAGDASFGNSEESEVKVVRTNSAPLRPTISNQPQVQTVPIGSAATFSIVATTEDEGILTYQWFKGANIIPGAVTSSYTIPSVSPSDIASYNVRVTNTLNGASATQASQSARINVLTDLEATTPSTGLKTRTNIPYRLALEYTGGAGGESWSIINGILPAGLRLDSMTGLITGSVSDSLPAGSSFTLTAQVRDRFNATSNTDEFVITLVESASVLATPELRAEPTLDAARSISLEWTLVESATSYSVFLYDSAGTLIKTTGLSGLTAGSIASTSINVNNYPDIATLTSYLVSVVANYDGPLAIGASLESVRESVTTGTNKTPPPVINGIVGVPVPVAPPAPQPGPALAIIPGAPFNLQVNAPGASDFRIESGTLPAGLTLDPRTGLITGTPTASGPYSFTILATPPVPGRLIIYSGNIVAPPAPTQAPQQTIRPGEPVNIQVNVPGANNFTVYSGSLPAGLTIDPRTGLITGTPTQSGPYDFTILATPPAQGTLVRFSGNVEVPAPTPQPVAPIQLQPGAAFNFTPNVPGANNFALRDGALPAGLTLDPATGRISGTPRESGPYSFSIIATPPANGILLTFSGTIEAPGANVVNPVVNPTLQTLDPITPSTPVLPQVNANLLVVSSGPTGNTTVLPNSGNNGLIVTSSEVVLSVAGIRANGNLIPLATGNQLSVQAGLKVEASGTGFLPNSEVFVYMFSTPQLIGKVKTDANGNYSEQLTVPASLSGNHILQVNGFLKTNEVKSISIAVIVTNKEAEKTPTEEPITKPAATKDKKIKIGAKGVVVPFKGKVISLSTANKKLIKQLRMPKNKGKEVYVLGYTRSTGKQKVDILTALNRAINVSKEIKRLNPKVKVGFAGLGTRTTPVCAKQKNICAVVTIR